MSLPVAIGHATIPDGSSGTTVIRPLQPAVCAHWVPGSAPGSREWATLSPDHLAGRIHALVLSGGSAHGLAAADGVMTGLVALATDAPLPHGACRVVAKMAAAALARTLRPAFTPFDGDVVFCLATGDASGVDPATLLRLGDTAADLLAHAIVGLFPASTP